ncbi:MAG: CpsD/CapB family tyrosine-protein kinase [Acidobacteriota bacterium]
MSRIFDALRKSEKGLQAPASVTPDTFIETMEKSHSGLGQVGVERARLRPDHRLVVYSDPQSLGAERFRLLRARLGHWQAAKKLKTLLVTSALPQDGKSLVAANLATALAGQKGCNVLLLEGDLRRRGLRSLLGINAWSGLSECLHEGSDPLSAIRRIEPLGFFLLPAGKAPTNPVELLQSQRFADVMRGLMPYFDWILIDSPPASPLADTPVLKTHADATLLVVRAGVTPREEIEEAVQLLGSQHVIGFVLNAADTLEGSYYKYYQYVGRNGSGTPKARREKAKGKGAKQ